MTRIAAIDTATDEGRKRKQVDLDILHFKGDFAHNIKVLKVGGELKVWRRPDEEGISYQMFTPCTFCLAFVQKHELWRHAAVCPLNEKRGKQALPKKRATTESLDRKAKCYYLVQLMHRLNVVIDS